MNEPTQVFGKQATTQVQLSLAQGGQMTVWFKGLAGNVQFNSLMQGAKQQEEIKYSDELNDWNRK